MFRIVLPALLAGFFATSSLAQQTTAPFDPITFELSYSAAETAQERQALLQQAITQASGANPPDLRVVFDLNTLLLDEIEQSGESAQAAQIAAQLAQFAAGQGASLGLDPSAMILRALRLAEQAGDYALVRRMFEFEYAYLQQGGQAGDDLARVWDRAAEVASRMGQDDEVLRWQQAASELRGAPAVASTRKAGDAGGFREVQVFYATDRAQTGSDAPAEFYGDGRGELEYGTLTVSIPNTHVPGAIEAPSIWRLEFTENPARHVVLQRITPLPQSVFFGEMQAEMATRNRKEAFVFIHGFNVRFDAAAKRAAQLAHDMHYRGVPVLYSWPSAGRTMSYVADTAVVRLSGRRLARFLEELRAQSGADVIHIVAHSMGNRALTDALELMAERRSDQELQEPLFGQVFFAAPDVDAGLFAEMTRTIRPLAQRLTLYTSSQDWALVTSRKLHGNMPRAGQGEDTGAPSAHLDTVDMSDLGEDMLAHSYFANDSSALVDIMALIWRNSAPDRRCGLQRSASEAWVYKQGVCNVGKIMGLIATAWQDPEVDLDQIRALISKTTTDPAEAAALEEQFVAIITE